MTDHPNSFDSLKSLTLAGKSYRYFDLNAAEKAGLRGISRLPVTLKVLLENLLRHEDTRSVQQKDIKALAAWLETRRSDQEIAFRPARVLMQDFTGVPAVVDLAAMREALAKLGADPQKINPLSPVDLVIDHSVMVDVFGTSDSFAKNVAREFERNGERYAFLRWGQKAFDRFRVVPPGTGICHQVNLEYLAQTVWQEDADGVPSIFPDTLVGTDSHTTMVNGLAVLGWGVGGIEAEAAMLGQPVSMLIPEVVGVELSGRLAEGATATDLVLTITQMLRRHGVVGKFVEFFGSGLAHLTLADRATIANMAPEYGATCGFFPVDEETLRYLAFTGRAAEQVALVKAYAKTQGLWREEGAEPPLFTETLTLDLATVMPSLAGPKRPQDRIALAQAGAEFERTLADEMGNSVPASAAARMVGEGGPGTASLEHDSANGRKPVAGESYDLGHGDVVIAAITSCTNTSNPSVLIAAGLLAQKAHAKGLTVKPWVKTSLAPGSQVVTDYLEAAGLMGDLEALGFDLVGYGCTTCIGNSGPLPDKIAAAVEEHHLLVASVLSGNRNFEGRINPHVKANYLASPPLVVAYALAGTMRLNLQKDPLGKDKDGRPVYLKDLWPSSSEIATVIEKVITPEMFTRRYADVFKGPEEWQAIAVAESKTYAWDEKSTYVAYPPFFEGLTLEPDPIGDITGARPLAILGDSVTTDHISPAGAIKIDSPAGKYLIDHGVEPHDFNSYGARRGNHEVMMRGTFANIRIRNEMVPGKEGGFTRLGDKILPIYDAAMAHQEVNTPLVVIAGKEYGTGSSRDWAAKGTRLLGVKAVIAESFERIHRSNLVGMGVLPLEFPEGVTRRTLELTGDESFDITGLDKDLKARQTLTLTITYPNGKMESLELLCRIDTADEVTYFKNGGILHTVLRKLAVAE